MDSEVDFTDLSLSVRTGGQWNKKTVGRALTTLERAGAPLNPQGLKGINETLYQRARQYYGSYDDALRDCTEKGLGHRKAGQHTREQFLATMRVYAANHDDLRVSAVQKKKAGAVSMVYTSEVFPDWETAMKYCRRQLLKEDDP